ncbi:carboxypeptidase-like regulatory domain-containing protein [Aquimarina gracilis]
MVKGVVFDKITNTSLSEVNVYLKNDTTGTITNKEGEFTVEVTNKTPKNDTIVFSHLGHQTKYLPLISIKDGELKIYLERDIQALNQVSITGNRKLQRRIKYRELSPLKRAIHSFGSVLVDNKIYVTGGDLSIQEEAHLKILRDDPSLTGPGATFREFLNELRSRRNLHNENYSEYMYVYDIDTDTWKKSEHIFRKRAYHNVNYYNNKIYISGGKRLSSNRKFQYLDDKIEILDLERDTILIENVNPHQAANSLSFIYKERMLVLGGSTKLKNNKTKIYSDKMRFLNLKTGLWYELGNIPKAKEIRGVLVNDKIYLFEVGSNRRTATTIETYDLQSGKWEKEGDLFNTIELPAITHHQNTIYFLDEGKIYSYNTKTKVLKEYLIDLYLKASNLHCSNDTLYVIGGFVDDQTIKLPSSRMVSIDLKDFERTKVNRLKQL